MNLAVNARDAMPEGGTLTIETRRVQLDGDSIEGAPARGKGPYALLVVSDTGTGMDVETRTRLFEPFFTTKAHGKGTGLGLATVYGIVQQSGGHIEVHTELGRGTTFKIYLPVAQEADGAVAAKAQPSTVADEIEASGAVLLVEDDAALRELLSRSLAQAGYAVDVAESAEEALGLVREGATNPDLLVTDVVMPGMSGPALARAMATIKPGLRVLLISGYTDDEMLRLGLLDAGQSLLLKPFGPRAFLRKGTGSVRRPDDRGRGPWARPAADLAASARCRVRTAARRAGPRGGLRAPVDGEAWTASGTVPCGRGLQGSAERVGRPRRGASLRNRRRRAP